MRELKDCLLLLMLCCSATWVAFAQSSSNVAPWGTQTITSRVVVAGLPGKSGPATHGRQFESAHQTSGTAALTRDDGFSAGLIISPRSYVDFNVGYVRSAQYSLDTIFFGIGVNVTALLGKTLRP